MRADYLPAIAAGAPALRAIVALDALFLIAYAGFFVMLPRALGVADDPLVRLGVRAMLAVAVLDMIEDHHLLAVAKAARAGLPVDGTMLELQHVLSQVKFHLSYLAVAFLALGLPRGSVITGRIVDEFGEPLTGAQVRVLRYGYAAGARRLLPAGQSDRTDDQGTFRVFGLPPGEYVVSATLNEDRALFRPRAEGACLRRGRGNGRQREVHDAAFVDAQRHRGPLQGGQGPRRPQITLGEPFHRHHQIPIARRKAAHGKPPVLARRRHTHRDGLRMPARFVLGKHHDPRPRAVGCRGPLHHALHFRRPRRDLSLIHISEPTRPY